jgi:hypothetical protein
MALNARNIPRSGGGHRQEPMEAGTYPCRVVQVIDLGVQEQRAYKGTTKPPAPHVMITYEFLDEFCLDEEGEVQEDKPRWLSETLPLYSLEADLAKSTKRYYSLDPDEVFGGDFTLLIDATCMVTINQYESKGEIKNGISSVAVMRAKEAAKAPALVNPPKVFLIDNPNLEVFKSLPDWLQDKIKKSLEFGGSALDEALKAPVKPADKPAARPKPNRQAPVQEEEDEAEVPLDEDGNPLW